MKIIIQRGGERSGSTFGTLTLDGGGLTLDTLEPAPPVTPAGTYNAGAFYSEHFGREVIRLQNVPGHEGIEIHPGNYPGQTHGCVLVGTSAGDGYVNDSQHALSLLFAALGPEPWTVEYHDAP